MKIQLLFVLLSCILVASYDTILGEANGRKMVYHTQVNYPAFTQTRRLKYVNYYSIDLSMINAIAAIDNLKSDSTANVLAGGIGYPFVTLKLRSGRARPLNYDIKIYS